MNCRVIVPLLLVLCACCDVYALDQEGKAAKKRSDLPADYLAKIDRTIGKEPEYTSKEPKYCLLVLGPKATTRMWLVLDGTTLYADRNCNGDLTDENERVANSAAAGAGLEFKVGEVEAAKGQVKPGSLTVCLPEPGTKPRARETSVTFHSKKKGATGNGEDGLEFAARREDAPVIHFGGPYTVKLVDSQAPLVPGRETELAVNIGTQGLGKGTFILGSYHRVPEEVKPIVELEFPNKDGGDPIQVKAVLTKRC